MRVNKLIYTLSWGQVARALATMKICIISSPRPEHLQIQASLIYAAFIKTGSSHEGNCHCNFPSFISQRLVA